MAKSGVWGRLHIKNPANFRWGDLRGQVSCHGLRADADGMLVAEQLPSLGNMALGLPVRDLY
jgi:hypothetical protein